MTDEQELYVQECFLDVTKGHRFGNSEWYKAYTNDMAKLFKDMQREYGRCTGKVYVGDDTQVGWIFQKKMQYENTPYKESGRYSKETYYLQDVWVSLSTVDPNIEQKCISPWEKKSTKNQTQDQT